MEKLYTSLVKTAIAIVIALSLGIGAKAQSIATDSLFEALSQTDRVHARTGDKVLRINRKLGDRTGYQKLIPINAGQNLTTEVYAFYEKKNNKRWFSALLGTAGVLATQEQPPYSGDGRVSGKNFPFVSVGVSLAPSALKGIFKKTPKAFIQYNFYNEDSTFVESVNEYVSKEARDNWQLIHIEKKAAQNGFVEITIINDEKKDIWFDDLTILLSSSVIQSNLVIGGPILNKPGPENETYTLYEVNIRSFAPPTSFSGFGYADDNRGFSLQDNSTSRIKMKYIITPDGLNPQLTSFPPVSDPTIRTSDGASMTGTPTGNATVTSSARLSTVNTCTVGTSYAGSNPFVTGAPNIVVGTNVTLTENFIKTKLVVTATVKSKRFPAWELFIDDLAGSRVFIAVEGAYGNPIYLVSASNDASTVTASFTININSAGVFQSVTSSGQTYSITNWNNRFYSQSAGPFPR